MLKVLCQALFWRAVKNLLPSEQNNKMICKTKTFFCFVCKDNYGFSVLFETAHKLVYLTHSTVIQIGIGFV